MCCRTALHRAIRMLLTGRDDIAVVGEASNFLETIQKTTELHPDLITLDLNQPDRDRIPLNRIRSLLNGARVLAMTFGTDDLDEGLLDSIGAVKLLDNMDLSEQLIPVTLELSRARARSAGI